MVSFRGMTEERDQMHGENRELKDQGRLPVGDSTEADARMMLHRCSEEEDNGTVW